MRLVMLLTSQYRYESNKKLIEIDITEPDAS